MSQQSLTNREFFEQHARAGCVGLVGGGQSLICKVIRRSERHLTEDKQWSRFSHAFLCEGRRVDGHHWVMESDLEMSARHFRFGVQENRIDKYFDEVEYPIVAILDFNLNEAQVHLLLAEGLEFVAHQTEYSVRELLGAAWTFHKKGERGKSNPLQKDRSMYCSAFVQHCYRKIGIDLVPGVHPSLGTPEDLSRSVVAHTCHLLERTGLTA